MPDATGAPSIETRQSWTVAITALVILTITNGAPMTVIIGLVPISQTLGTGRSIPSFATTLAYVGTGLGGILCGLLAARLGQRRVAILGGLSILAGLALASLGQIWSLLVGIGLGVGLFGNGALFSPLVAYVSLWFDRRRGTALALVSSGQSLSGVIWPAIFERSIAAWGWQATMLGHGILVAVAVVTLALLVLAPAPVQPTGASAPRQGRSGLVLGMRPNVTQALIATCAFLCCVPMAMPTAHLVAFCGDLGITASHGAALLSVMRAAACLSRAFWGWMSDRLGGLRTVFIGSAAQIAGMLGFLATQDEAGLFFVAAAYGLGFGGIIPAYVLAIRELFPASEASWRIPTVLFMSLSGMGFGAWLAGVIYDTVGFYAAAWWVGIVAGCVQLSLVGFLVLRWHLVDRA